MCFLRDLPADDAMATLEQALAHRDVIFGVGLDSAEVGQSSGEVPRRLRAGDRRRVPRRRARRRGGAARVHLAGARRARRGEDRSRRALPGGSSPRSAPRGRSDSADRVPVLERQAAGRRNARAAPAREDARARTVRHRQLRRSGLLRRLRRREPRRGRTGPAARRRRARRSSPATASKRRSWTTPRERATWPSSTPLG